MKRRDEALVGIVDKGQRFRAVWVCLVEFETVVHDRVGLEMLASVSLCKEKSDFLTALECISESKNASHNYWTLMKFAYER